MTEVLSSRALNRALLARQSLLRPRPLPPEGAGRAEAVTELIEHLGGLQAQAPFPPYYGLWSRLTGFRPTDLADLLTSRRVVRIALMRGTIHLVSARDCLTIRPLLRPVFDHYLRMAFGAGLAELDIHVLARDGRALVEESPRTFAELGALLSPRWPGHQPAALAQGVRSLVPLVQVPPRAVWGSTGQAKHTSAEAWLGQPLATQTTPEAVVRRYLAAFGPATAHDVRHWSAMPALGAAMKRMRDELVVFRDERGRELFDVPDAPLPGPGTPAPVRLVAEFDNLILSHADRSRVISQEHRRRIATPNGLFPGTLLVDGFVAGKWRITRSPGAATLTVEPFAPISARDRAAAGWEAERLLEFAAADAATHEIQFTRPA